MKFKMLLLFSFLLAGCAAIPHHKTSSDPIQKTIPDKGSTSWMTLSQLDAFMETFKSDIPGAPNYWDKGHWIESVEGRWHKGAPQYRLRYGKAPKDQGYWWYWYINQDEASFNEKIHKYADDGFILAYYNKIIWPDGSPRYQAVWHKYGKKK